MRRLKTGRRPPIYPKTPGHLPCSSLTHPLPLSSRRPSVSFGGFGLNKTGLGLGETDATKFQLWRDPSTSTVVLEGDVVIEVWAAIKDYGTGKRGVLTVFLRDRDPSGPSYTEIGNATVFDTDWQEGATDFIMKTLLVPDVSHTVPSGNQLEARLLVDDNSEDSMWVAYDTAAYPSAIKIDLGPPALIAGAIAADDFESGDLSGGTGWLDTAWITAGTVTVTSSTSPQQGTFHMRVDRQGQGQADRTVDMSGQTSPRLLFWGKVEGITGGREAYAEVSSDGTTFTVVKTWTAADSGNPYAFEDIDLSPFTMSSQFWIRFSAPSTGPPGPALFVDDVQVRP